MAALLLLAAPLGAQSDPLEAEKARLTAFYAELAEVSAIYEPVKAANEALLDEGLVAESTQRLLHAVPETQRTAVHDFLLGNILFDVDPALALSLHERAAKAAPDNVMIALEWAIELHRAGRWTEAEPIYARLLLHPLFEGSNVAALQAEVLLRLDRPAEAVAAWKQLDVPRLHTQIETALGWIHAPLSPWTRRAQLLERVATKDSDAARDLIFLDLKFDRDWWNVDRRDDYLAADFVCLDAAFGADARRVLELKALVQLCQTRPAGGPLMSHFAKPDAAALGRAIERLVELELLGDGPRHSGDMQVTEALFEAFVETGVAPWSQIAEVFEDTLRAGIESEAGDPRKLALLCAIYERVGDAKLAELERYGWDRYGDLGCAAGLVAASLREGRPDEALLAEALGKSPGDPELLRLSVEIDERAGRTPPAATLRALILASDRKGPDARWLDALCAKLEASIEAAK